MNKKTTLNRPALTAIAAALAFASTPVWAQDTLPADSPSVDAAAAPATTAPAPVVTPENPVTPESSVANPLTPQSSAPAPALPPIVMPSPAPQAAPAPVAPVAVATPQLPEVEAQPQAEQPREPVSGKSVARATPVERAERTSAPTRAAPAAPVAAAPVTPPVAQPSESPVLQAPNLTPSDVRATQQPAPAPEMATPQQDDTAYWVLGAGGAALVFGFGALAFMRRRNRKADGARTPLVTETVTWNEPVAAKPKRAVAHAAPRASARTGARTGDAQLDKLEAMVAKKPNAANPFVTRAKRLRRASFILNNDGHAPAKLASTPAPVEEVKAAVAAAPSKKEQKQPVFSYAKKPASARSTGRKLATS